MHQMCLCATLGTHTILAAQRPRAKRNNGYIAVMHGTPKQSNRVLPLIIISPSAVHLSNVIKK